MTRPTYDQRCASGKCTICHARPARPGQRRCDPCAERAKRSQAARRAAARSLGLCVQCQAKRAVDGRGGRCKACADALAVYLAEYRGRAAGEVA